MTIFDIYRGMAMQKYAFADCMTEAETCSTIEHTFVRAWNSYGFHLCLFSHALSAAILYRTAANKQKDVPAWFFSLLSVTFSAFSGGTLAPISISSGQFPFIVRNDSIFLFCVLVWALTSSPTVVRLLSATPVKLVWTNLAMINRSHTICELVNATTRIISSSKGGSTVFHYWGPVVVAVIVSCGGMFFPLSKGFAPLAGQYTLPAPTAASASASATDATVPGGRSKPQKQSVPAGSGTPFVIQGAFLVASFYHVYTHDRDGMLGKALHTVVHWLLVVVFARDASAVPEGSLLTLTEGELRISIVLFWHVMMSTQLLCGGYNPLSPLWDVLYWISGVQGPQEALKAAPAPALTAPVPEPEPEPKPVKAVPAAPINPSSPARKAPKPASAYSSPQHAASHTEEQDTPAATPVARRSRTAATAVKTAAKATRTTTRKAAKS